MTANAPEGTSKPLTAKERQTYFYPPGNVLQAVRKLADQDKRTVSTMVSILVEEALRARGVTVE
jgi:hypothetical protein